MRKRLTFLLLFTVSIASAQKIPDYGFNKIRIALSDRIIQADVAPLKSDPGVATDKLYYWSSSNAIHTTQGGFSGKLLNGAYAEYYLNKNLKEQGQFKGGLKDGIWKSWNESGTLTELYSWDEGIRSGRFELFGSDGKLKQSGYYKNNLLHGKITNYSADGTSQLTMYKGGKVTEKKASFFNKINVFRRLKRDSTEKTPAQ